MRPWPCAEVRGGFYVSIAMSIMHEQPRRTWPQNVPYLHLTGVDTEGGVVGPLRLWLREEGDIDLKDILAAVRNLDRFLVTRCRSPRSMPMPQPSDVEAQYCNA